MSSLFASVPPSDWVPFPQPNRRAANDATSKTVRLLAIQYNSEDFSPLVPAAAVCCCCCGASCIFTSHRVVNLMPENIIWLTEERASERTNGWTTSEWRWCCCVVWPRRVLIIIMCKFIDITSQFTTTTPSSSGAAAGVCDCCCDET